MYGTAGIGKSTWASMAPKPVFISTEDGLGDIQAQAFPECKSLADMYRAMDALLNEPHDFETVAIDTIDWAERKMTDSICEEGGKATIADFGFGKGYEMLVCSMSDLLKKLSALSGSGMNIILLGHADVQRFNDPERGEWDRYKPRLHKRTVDMVCEWCTEVLFATYEVYTTTEDAGFNKKRTRASGAGQRVIRTQERPTHIAKNRLHLPYEIPLDMTKMNIFDRGNVPQSPIDAEAEDVF